MAATKTTARRSYQSSLREKRAAETRSMLLQAAHRLFVAKGWAATGMRDVAAEAGIATETVYSHFASKRGLLLAVIDVAAAGDDAAVSVADRPEFAAMGRGRRADRIRAAARFLVAIQGRTAALARVLREAASADAEIADVLRTARESQRADVARALELILGRRATPLERDGVWAIVSPEVYVLLVDESAWSVAQYENWIFESLNHAIPRT